ncbi:MAG: DUF488 domain-containing protein [Armatimonadetes bacterium]|nr:DUF488 domain-containing protein [Armatimonadota bacterium]
MDALYTIGYTKKTLREFISRLRTARVDCVVDIRLNNTSQLAGFSKRDDLDFLLKEGFGIGYVHVPEFAPTEEMLGEYKTGKDWDLYESRYWGLTEEREMSRRFVDLVKKNGWRRPCLLCAEPEADHCHRRILATAVEVRMMVLEVIHL